MKRFAPSFAMVCLSLAGLATSAHAGQLKTVCASGCDYTSLQSAITSVPNRTTAGDGFNTPYTIQVQPGVLSVDASLSIANKSYLTIEGFGDKASIVRASTTWFNNSSGGGTAERFLSLTDSDNIVIREISIDATTNTTSGIVINESGGGVAAVYVERANPVFIESATITGFEWGLRDANPGSGEAANNNRIEISGSRILSQYVAAWVAGGSVWLAYSTAFEAVGDLSTHAVPNLAYALYYTGAFPSGAKNLFTGWGCHFHAEGPGSITLRGVDFELANAKDVLSIIGSTIHAKSTATSGTTQANVEAMFVATGNAAATVDVSGSEIVYEGPTTITSGVFTGVANYLDQATVNLTGSSIIDRARDDSTNPPTLAGSTHQDVWRAQGPGGTKPSTVHVIGSRARSITGHSSSLPQSLDTVENQAGTVTLVPSGGTSTATVTLPTALPSTKYRVALSVNANETVWVSAKTATTFTIQSSNNASTATVDWIVRY